MILRHKTPGSLVRASLMTLVLLAAFGAEAATVIAPNDPPDLGTVPPDLGTAVNPNIIVTFDDSGSMANTYMGDDRPYDNGSWNGPWACANAIDPRVTTSTNPASRPMNGVYYNPNTTYSPALYEDGSTFPNADSTLTAVWEDGISPNRPSGAVTTTGTVGYNNNPQGSGTANTSARTNIMGQYTKTPNVARSYSSSTNPTCPGTADTGSCQLVVASGSSGPSSGAKCSTYVNANTGATTNAYNCSCTGSGSSKRCSWSNTYTWTITTYTITDNRWECGTGPGWSAARATQNPFDGTLADPDTGAMPNGGPLYWRYKSSADSLLTTDSSGNFTAAALTALYNSANWEAVSVPSSQYQNFANWYAYYRYRNLMARTAMSRVFGVIGSPNAANVRVLWQNINNATYGGGNNSLTGLNGLPISVLTDVNTDPYGTSTPYRQAFFNWIFQVGASGNTPTRTAAIRAGNYLCDTLNGNCNGNNSSTITNSKNPWWNESSAGSTDPNVVKELACRQNFHMMMTDGLYNSPAKNVSGNASNTNTNANLTGNPPQPVGEPTTYPYATGKNPTTIFGHTWTTDSDGGSSYSDIAFYYWANNLRTTFKTAYPNDSVPVYYPDITTGVTATAAAVDPKDPGLTPEVFWNPVNDPASWPHLVQYAVTLGAFGDLTFSEDIDCNKDDGYGVGKDDLCKLRTGVTNSTGSVGWPRPNGAGSGIAANIDDLWHAALNARGSFFVATDPQALVTHLTSVLTNIASRISSSVAVSVNGNTATSSSGGFTGGYNSTGWTGYLQNQALDPTTGAATGPILWDSSCTLTGGLCASTGTGTTSTQPQPIPRVIFTSVGTPGSLSGVAFEWANLPSGGNEAKSLNLSPSTTHPDTTTGLLINGSTTNGTADANGQYRVGYIRGDRTYESSPTPNGTTFRPRSSVLGAIVDSQAVYEAAPHSAWMDIYPANSPEQTAGKAGNTYEAFVKQYLTRNPLIYVGANDGMLHAFNTTNGVEQFAYVPNLLYNNGQLTQLTNPQAGLIDSVDDTPIIQDVFLTSDNAWHTLLIGGLRLGGRGIYALDITKSDNITSEGSTNPFLWEFSSQQDSDLGYTYATTNIARLRCNKSPCKGTAGAGGTWVVLVTSGYFPQCLPAAQGSSTCTTNGFSASDTAAGATTNKSGPTYLWVLNATDGSLIAKIATKSGITSYGLSTPSVVDFGLDQLDDVVVAGDLAGNLWRFDLTNPDPTQWTTANVVDAMFETYTSTSSCNTSNTHGIGCEPISVMPVAFPDSVNGGVVYVFGSGQYLGATDNTTASVYTPQHFFGVRDFGTHYTASDGGSSYPFHESDLNSRSLTQTGTPPNATRSLPYTPTTTATHPRGWQIPLDVEAGERDTTTATPLFSIGAAILTSLIPGQNTDPCEPGRSGAVMAINASSGGPAVPSTNGATSATVGELVSNPPATGGVSVISSLGGGTIILPGMGANGGTAPPQFDNLTPVWRRTSWSELLNQL